MVAWGVPLRQVLFKPPGVAVLLIAPPDTHHCMEVEGLQLPLIVYWYCTPASVQVGPEMETCAWPSNRHNIKAHRAEIEKNSLRINSGVGMESGLQMYGWILQVGILLCTQHRICVYYGRVGKCGRTGICFGYPSPVPGRLVLPGRE